MRAPAALAAKFLQLGVRWMDETGFPPVLHWMWQERPAVCHFAARIHEPDSLNASETTLRPELPPRFSLITALTLALLLPALISARAGYFRFALEAVSISPALADGRGHSSGGGDGGGSSGSSSHSGGEGSSGGSSYSSSSGSSSYGSSGGGGDNSSGSGSSSGGNSGGNAYSNGNSYNGSGSGSPRGDDGGGYSYNGNGSSGYSYSGYSGGGAVPHGDGRPPSVGVPQPELSGLPKDLGLEAAKDDKAWESLLNQHFDPQSGLKGAEHALDAKSFAGFGQDHPKASTPVKGSGSQSPAGNASSPAPQPGSYSPTQVLASNLSPAGLARAQALGFQIGGGPAPGGRGPGPGGPGAGPGGPGGLTIMTVPHGLDPAQAMHLLEQNVPGDNFQLNRLYRLYQPATKDGGEGFPASPATPGGKKCSGDRCYAQTAIQWKDNFSACARNARIGVIDTGFDLRHPAFKSQKIAQKAFVPEGKSPADTWHGTGVLALLAGRRDSGTPGLAPDATYHAASIFYADEGGGSVTDTVSFLKALDWLSESGVKLVNMSFTGPRDDLVRKKIESLSARGVVFAAAAGNDGPTAEPAYPAAYPQVIAVTALTKDLRNYPYANRGAHIDVAAPGVDIWTAWPEAREGYRSGTSFASPFVTGILAIYPAEALRGSKDAILEHVNIADLGPPGRDPIYGRGLLQAPSSCPGNSSEVASLRPEGRQ